MTVTNFLFCRENIVDDEKKECIVVNKLSLTHFVIVIALSIFQLFYIEVLIECFTNIKLLYAKFSL